MPTVCQGANGKASRRHRHQQDAHFNHLPQPLFSTQVSMTSDFYVVLTGTVEETHNRVAERVLVS